MCGRVSAVLRTSLFLAIAMPALVSCSAPVWAPDGKKLAVTWPSPDGTSVLRVVDAATGAWRTVPQSEHVEAAAWSPDGAWLLFSAPEGPLNLYDTARGHVRRIDKSGYRPLVWREDSARALVANGGRLVCLNMPDGAPAWEAALPSSGHVRHAEWVQDTDIVAVQLERDIWLYEGGEPVRVTTTGDVLGFVVRRRGTELLWARSGANPRYVLLTLYSMSIKHRSARRLGFAERVATVNPTPRHAPTAVYAVSFSPNGDRLAVQCVFEKGRNRETHRCYVMDAQGRSARMVWERTRYVDPEEPATLVATPPTFSPDGRRLAFLADTGRRVALLTCNVAEGTCRALMKTAVSSSTTSIGPGTWKVEPRAR